MEIFSDEDLTYFIEIFQKGDAKEKTLSLKNWYRYPTGDKRILPYIENLLEDRGIYIINIPFRYGEVRYLAAYALVAEYKLLGIDKTIELKQVMLPTEGGYSSVARELGIKVEDSDIVLEPDDSPPEISAKKFCKKLEILRDIGKIPLEDLIVKPGDTPRYI